MSANTEKIFVSSPGTISLLWCRVTTEATSSSTVNLRKNGANANNTFSINANTTGAFSDSTPHNDSISTGDLIVVEVVAGSSALIIDIIAFAASPSSNTVTRLGCMKSQMHLKVQPVGSCRVLVLMRTLARL
jgi:hypothetical protein